MAELDPERDLLNSYFALFNQLVREQGASFLAEVRREIEELVVNGATRSEATRTVIEREVLADGGALDGLRDRMVSEFKRLMSQASAGVFQRRLADLAERRGEPEFVWVSVLSSSTCDFKAGSSKYVFKGRPMQAQDFCAPRHGLRGPMSKFVEMGLPRTGGTVCLASCECVVVPASMVAEHPGLLAPVLVEG